MPHEKDSMLAKCWLRRKEMKRFVPRACFDAASPNVIDMRAAATMDIEQLHQPITAIALLHCFTIKIMFLIGYLFAISRNRKQLCRRGCTKFR